MKTAHVALEYQSLIQAPPVEPRGLYAQACSNDERTVYHWADKWLANIKANHDTYGTFKEHSVGSLLGKYKYMPIILAGSGPSLKHNASELKNRGEIPLVSCLHNFHLFEELEIAPEYYCTLDAGEVTSEEVSEGGQHDPDWYWERSKDRTLIAYIGTDPALLAKWQGEVYFFNAPVPDVPNRKVTEEVDAIEKFNMYLSNGGNVLGSCMYFAKGVLGGSTMIFVGADFCFDHGVVKDGAVSHKFHSWDSKYDKSIGTTIRCTDIYGNSVKTWASYRNFKSFFDWVAMSVPGDYINCSEAGTMGAYPGGNLAAFKYMDLNEAFKVLNLWKELEGQCKDPEGDIRKILY